MYGVNIFSDLSPQEFRGMYLQEESYFLLKLFSYILSLYVLITTDKYLSGLKRSGGKTVGYQHSRTPTQTLPDKFDW